MRILHLPYNIASQILVCVNAFREIGHDALGIINQADLWHSCAGLKSCAGARSDCRPFSPRWFRDRAGAYAAVLSAIAISDIVHYHFGGTTALPQMRDLRLATALGKVRLITFWGSDIRVAEIECEDNPYFAPVCPLTPKWADVTREKSYAIQEMYASKGFACVLGSESMLAHVDRTLFPEIHLVRCAIDTRNIQPAYPRADTEKVIVVHSPSDPAIKGTPAVMKAVESLRRKKLPFEFVLIENTPRERALDLLRRADIFLDQFVLGAYGMAAIEAMAMGKPVMCYIKPSLVREYPADSPVVNAPQERIADMLEELIVDGELRERLGRASRHYAEKYHDGRKAAEQLINIYERLQGR